MIVIPAARAGGAASETVQAAKPASMQLRAILMVPSPVGTRVLRFPRRSYHPSGGTPGGEDRHRGHDPIDGEPSTAGSLSTAHGSDKKSIGPPGIGTILWFVRERDPR